MLRVGVLIILFPLIIAAQPVMPASYAANPLLGDTRTRIVRTRTAVVMDLPWATLAASGWDLATLDTTNVQIWRQGAQIAAHVTAAGIGFLATANDSPFNQEAAYWVGIGATPGLRTLLPAHSTAPLTWEPDLVYQSLVATARGDRWFAGELRTNGTPLEATITLPNALPSGSRIDLALTPFELRSGHQVQVWNGTTLLGNATWDDSTSGPRTLSLTTSAALPAGSATLRLVLASAGADVVLLDKLTIPAALVTLPTLTPPLETPRPAPTLTGADQQIIAYPDLIPALDPLISAKQQRGRSVAVADVLAIYDTYSWGERDPEAIRDYLRDVAAGPHRPTSVLLMGAGTVRMRVGPGESDPTLIPPYLLVSDAVYGEIACETCYTRLSDGPPQTEPLPDLPIGRLPASTLAEATMLIAKTVTALTPPSGAWRTTALLVADNDREADGTPDPAGPFSPLLANIATALPDMHTQSFVYAPDQTHDTGPYQHAAVLRAKLLPAWDAGAALVAYVGHANAWQWAWTGATEPVADLLARGDAVRTNGARLPILISLTCLSGAFANPTMTAIDEALLRQADGGIIAALTPSGSGVNMGHTLMLAAILPALRSGQTLGTAHLAGLGALLAQPNDHALVFSYSILGDPDVTLPPPDTRTVVFLPEVRTGYQLSAVRRDDTDPSDDIPRQDTES